MKRNPSLSKLHLPDEFEPSDVHLESSIQDHCFGACDEAKAPSAIYVTFVLECAETRPGETILVVGSSPALGSWKPELGVALVTGPESYPRWTGNVSVSVNVCMAAGSSPLIEACDIEYKYVRDLRCLYGGFAWEGGVNRSISLPLCKAGSEWLTSDPAFEQPGNRIPQALGAPAFEAVFRVLDQKPLERGTFGAVWRCCPTGGNQDSYQVAAKRIEKPKLEDRDKRNLFGSPGRMGEIALHLQQQHPNIVQLLDFFNEAFEVVLVMELCHGGDLFSCILKHRSKAGSGLEERVVARIARQSLCALTFLHDQAICHRDVKCENILLAESGLPLDQITYKLCDFGFARKLHPGSKLLTLLGSPQTVAPEVLKKVPYSFPSDMWSAGVLLYICLNAKEPFYASSMTEVVKKVILGNYDLSGGIWKEISEAARSTVAGLMNVDQDARLTGSAALRSSWLRA